MNGVEVFFCAYGSVVTTAVVWAVLQGRKIRTLPYRKREWTFAHAMNIGGMVTAQVLVLPLGLIFLTMDAVKLYKAVQPEEWEVWDR